MIKLVPRNEEELVEMLDDLIADIKEQKNAMAKTRLKQRELMREIDKVEAEFNKTDRKLKWIFEDNIGNKIIGRFLNLYSIILKRWL